METLKNRATSGTRQGFALKQMALALAGIGCLSVSAVAMAQQAQQPAGSSDAVVVVSGVRKAAETAQKIKMDSDNVIDSIVADDIGKFPDTNVAETLARVTGIQVRRDGGEANTTLIRGLPGIATFLNGREMFTTTGRYIQLRDIPSTMLQRADVYKSQSAEQIEGGIAGAIDVRTNRPFDFKGFQASAQLGVKNKDKANATDPEGSAMVSNRWKTSAGEFGALVGISHIADRFQEERSWESFPNDHLNGTVTGPDLGGSQAVFGKRTREAANFALQWKPNQDFDMYAEGLYSKFKGHDETDFFVGLPWATSPDQIKVTTIPGTRQVDTIDSTNDFTILSTQARASTSIAQQYAIGANWRPTSGLRASTEIARTISVYDWVNPILDTNLNVDNVHFKTVVDGGAFAQFQGVALNDPSKINLFQFFDRYGNDHGSSTDWRADAAWTPESDGFFKEFSGGVRVNDRVANSIKSLEGSVPALPNVAMGSVAGLSCSTPKFSADFGTPKWSTPCSDFMVANTGVVRNAVTGTSAAKALDPASYFQDTEKNYAFYGKAKFGVNLGPYPLDGVLGARVTRTDEELVGNNIVNGAYVPINTSSSSTNVLPSANFKLTLRPDLITRLALTKTLTRPDFAQLNPATAYVNSNGTTVQANASGGNPELKPFIGKNADASLEWYFSRSGYASATVFRHNFDGYIMNKAVPEVFQGITYRTSRPFNTDNGHLQGVELAYRQFYDGLPGLLSGLGLEANFTYTEGGVTSSVDPGLQGKPFAGMSRQSYNLVLLYERDAWSGRLAYNWRSKFVQVYGDDGNRSDTSPARDLIAAAMSTLDGSLSYKVSKDLTVNLTGTNLLNFKYQDYWMDPVLYPRDTRRYDRTVGLALNWKTN
jgi:iron complex outermembrane recepter protein